MKHSQTKRAKDVINQYILLRTFRKQKFYFGNLVLP